MYLSTFMNPSPVIDIFCLCSPDWYEQLAFSQSFWMKRQTKSKIKLPSNFLGVPFDECCFGSHRDSAFWYLLWHYQSSKILAAKVLMSKTYSNLSPCEFIHKTVIIIERIYISCLCFPLLAASEIAVVKSYDIVKPFLFSTCKGMFLSTWSANSTLWPPAGRGENH